MPPSTPSDSQVVTIYTIGHSTRPLPEFLSILQSHAISTLVDIRAFPVSRRFPHFSKERLAAALEERDIRYQWMPSLGGHRAESLDGSPHTALRSGAFRNYADYMLSPEFEHAAREIISIAEASPTACMCAEKDYRQCHRKLVSDWLVAHGHKVLHITDSGAPHQHEITPEARLEGHQLIYRGDRLF